MAVKRVDRREYEDQLPGSVMPMKVFGAVALLGLAIIMIYITVATPQQGTLMGAIQNVLYGLGGSAAIGIGLILVWLGLLCAVSARGRRVRLWKVLADGLLILCVFAGIHIFSAETIVRTRMTIQGYANFISKSYSFGQGGGALGALLCWPLYRSFGLTGGFFGILLIALLLLTITGRMGSFVGFVSDKIANARERAERRTDEMEQTPDPAQAQPRARAARARRGARVNAVAAQAQVRDGTRGASRPRVNRDPHSEAVISGEGAVRGTQARRPRPVRVPATDEVQSAARRPAAQEGERPAKAAGPRRRPVARTEAPEIDFESEIAAAAEAGRKRAAEQPKVARKAPAKKKAARPEERQLFDIQDIPEEEIAAQAAEAAPAAAPIETSPVRPAARSAARPKAKTRPEPGMLTAEDMAAMGFDTGDVDDFDRLEAAAMLADRQEKAARESFQPDRPAALGRKKEAEKVEAAADSHVEQQMEQLKIKPEAYELPDEEDETPFDLEDGIVRTQKKALPKLKRAAAAEEAPQAPEYNYPPIDLLAQGEAYDSSGHAKKDMEKAQLLEETLKSFGISSRLIGIAHGPAVTRFELQPAAGVKVSRITSLSDDIALNLAAMSVRIEAPIPGKAAVGVEIPNDKIEMVRLRDVLESSEARKHPSKIAVGLGKDNSGRYIVADIAKMPHVLIAGQTGSGKSVCINSIITSILFRASPEEVRLILIDPKVVELSIYNDIPHLVCPVVTDPKKAASALEWAVTEMTGRYKKFADRGVRDIKGYNKSLQPGEAPMPQMVIIIDELADLMMVSPGEVEDSICRLAQLARACGMHLVIATQRPSVNVITGIIKANIPTRIAFSVASQVDSRTMIDHGGAEKLLGNGDMLFVPNGINKPMRVQGAWVSDEEVHAIVNFIKQSAETAYDPDMLEHLENAVRSDAEKEEFESEYDPRLPEAVEIVMEAGQASVSMLQRRMRVGYARAGRLIDEMAIRGIVSEADGSKPRTVLITREQFEQMFED